jgi:hypothetical protein
MFNEVPGGRKVGLPPPRTMGRDRQSTQKRYKVNWDICKVKSCNGILIPGQQFCIAHAPEPFLSDWIRKRKPGMALDLRGVPLNSELFDQILAAYRDTDGWIKIHEMRLQNSIFDDPISISHISVEKGLSIANAHFNGGLSVDYAQIKAGIDATLTDFHDKLQIADSKLSGRNEFGLCKTSGAILFARVTGNNFTFSNAEFGGKLAVFVEFDFDTAWFDETNFVCRANFQSIQNNGQFFFHSTKFRQGFFMEDVAIYRANFLDTVFEGVCTFSGISATELRFIDIEFPQPSSVGPIMVDFAAFNRCLFNHRVEMTVLGAELDFSGCNFRQGATIAGKYAKASFENARFGAESTIMSVNKVSWTSALGIKIEGREISFDETKLRSRCKDTRFKIASFRGVDVSRLLLVNVSLEPCLFAGSYNLDKLRIESPKPFADTPFGFRTGFGWPPVWRWTRRQCLAEEYQWRSTLSKPFGTRPEVKPPKFMGSERQRKMETLDAERLSSIYRSLRKSLEDGKNEPGAADFYYGEMEARRRSTATPRVERAIIWLYWLISGYSLRGTRSFICLAISIFGLSWFMLNYGFAATGAMSYLKSLVYTASATASISYDQVALTEWGKVLRIVVRILGPLFLGLTIFSIRNRVKR